VSIRPSVCPFITSGHCTKTVKRRITQRSPGDTSFLFAKNLGEIPTGSPRTGVPNAGGVGKNCFFRPVEKSPAETPYHRKFVSFRHGGPRPRRRTGRGIHGIVNNSGGNRRSMIAVTVQLTSTRLIVWKSVDDTYIITAYSLCDS